MSGRSFDWRRYFDEAWFQLYGALYPEDASRREAGAMRELLGLPYGARILDAPCGWGRHASLFVEAGLDVHGADLSTALLARAPRSASAGPYLAAADMRFLPYADRSFDGVVNVFTSPGVFPDDADAVRALAEALRVLRPGGSFLLESMHRDDVVRAYAERDAWTLPDGTEVHVRRRFDAFTGISHERLRWRRGGASGEKRHALRLRTATEIASLMGAAGFVEPRAFGDWDGARFTHRSEHLILVAERPTANSLAR